MRPIDLNQGHFSPNYEKLITWIQFYFRYFESMGLNQAISFVYVYPGIYFTLSIFLTQRTEKALACSPLFC